MDKMAFKKEFVTMMKIKRHPNVVETFGYSEYEGRV